MIYVVDGGVFDKQLSNRALRFLPRAARATTYSAPPLGYPPASRIGRVRGVRNCRFPFLEEQTTKKRCNFTATVDHLCVNAAGRFTVVIVGVQYNTVLRVR
jgi:hypothetical protein